MDFSKAITLLSQSLGEKRIKLNESMSSHTSFKTGGNADIFVEVMTKEELIKVLEISNKENVPIFILGNGSNILVTDKGIRGIVCKINITKFEIKEDKEDVFVTVGSGNKNAELAMKLKNLEIEGFEFASGIPRNNRWCNKHECRCLWKRNERHCLFYNLCR